MHVSDRDLQVHSKNSSPYIITFKVMSFYTYFLGLRGYSVKFVNCVDHVERQMKRGTRRLAFRVHGTRSINRNAGTHMERGGPLERSGSNTDQDRDLLMMWIE